MRAVEGIIAMDGARTPLLPPEIVRIGVAGESAPACVRAATWEAQTDALVARSAAARELADAEKQLAVRLDEVWCHEWRSVVCLSVLVVCCGGVGCECLAVFPVLSQSNEALLPRHSDRGIRFGRGSVVPL